MPTLHEILPQEAHVKSRSHKLRTQRFRELARPSAFDGEVRTFEKIDDDYIDLPEEVKLVERKVDDIFREIREEFTELYDLEATKNEINRSAAADVIVDGVTVFKDLSSTSIMFLIKELEHTRTFVQAAPTLSPTLTWTHDDNSGQYVSAPVKTHRTEKVQRPIVLVEATEKHPAQAQLITEQQTVGYWNKVQHSGAIPEQKKRELLRRVEKLSVALKEALGRANQAEAPSVSVGDALFNYVGFPS